MSKTLLRNNSQSPITLPPPYTGIIAPGDAVVLDDPPSVVSEVLGLVPELITFLVATQVPDAQPVDGHDRAEAAAQIAGALASLTEPLDLNGQKIVNVADPTNPQDAATKAYVDAHGGGGGGGTVTNVSSTNAYLTVANGTTTPQLTVHVGTGATDVAAGTDARFNPAPSTAGAVVYDTGAAYAETAAGSVGQVLKVGAGGLPEWAADSTAPSGPAGGSLAGTYPNPSIAPGAISNAEVSATAAIATSKLSGLLTDIAGNGLSSTIAASTLPARTYYVAVNGNDLNDGSLSAPFATIQAAHDEAATAYSAGEMVQILVGPGDFSGNLNLTRYNTMIQGAGHRAEMFATRIVGSILVNPSTATDKYAHQVGLAGCMVSNSSTAAAVRASGSGLYALILNDCYLYSNNAAAAASALSCDATNASRPRIVANECILATEVAGPSIMQLDRGDVRMDATQIRHNSGVTSGAAGSGIVVANNATLWLNGSLVETRTRGSAIDASGASSDVKLLLTNTGVTAAYAGAENTTHGITVNNTTGVAALLYQVSFNVADVSAGVYAINGSAPAVVTYADVSFQYGTNSAIAPAVLASALPQTETHGTVVLPSLTASLPLKLDANKTVTSAAISLAGSEVAGTLAVGKGGTGISTTPPAGSVAYGNGSTQAYTAVGASGQPLLSAGTGTPAFGSLDLSVAGNVTGALPESNQADQTMGGDASGSTGSMTVTGLQGRPMAATAPASGQVVAWSGSAWEPATVSTGGGGGGASGLAYYFNGNTAGEAPVYAVGDKELSLVYNTGSQYNTGAVAAPALGTEAILAEFITNVGEPGTTTIPPGIWDFNFYLLSSMASGTQFRVRLYKWDGSTLTELAESPSDFVVIDNAGPAPAQFAATLYVEQAILTMTDRLVAQIEISSVDATTGRTVTGYFNGNTPSHVHTSIGAPGGTGVVKVVDGVIQTPATGISNADVDSSAAIVVSKLDGNSESGAANKVLHGSATPNGPAVWGAVALGSDVSGQLPVDNGGTGLASGTAGGLPYFSASTTMASSSALTANALVLGGGTSGPSTLASLGTSTTVLHGNATGAPTWGAISLTTDVSGTLPIAQGGTNGTAAPTAGEVAYGDGASYAFTTGSSAGKLLQSNGISPPSWLDIVPYTAGGTGTNAVPTANQVPYGTGTALTYTSGGSVGEVLGIGAGGQPEWISNGSSPTGAAGGDLSSNYPNPTVAKINGTTISTAGGALTTGTILRVTGASSADWGALDLGNASALSGTLPVHHGGTGISTVPALGTIPYGDGTTYALLANGAGDSGKFLKSNGVATPSWASLAFSDITGTLTTAAGGTGLTSYTAGDLLYYASGTALSNLGISGTSGAVLTADGSAPAWATGALITNSSVTIQQPLILTQQSAETVVAATTISSGSVPKPYLQITATAPTTLTSTPTIRTTGVTAGTVITLVNTGSNTIILQDNNQLAGTMIQLGGVSSRALNQYSSIDLIFDGTYWIERAVGGSGSVQSVTASAANSLITVGGTAENPTVGITGLTGSNPGTAGGIPYFSGTATLSTSAQLASNRLVIGGGGGAPSTLASGGTSGQPLLSGGGSAPAFGALDISTAAVTGTLPLNKGGTGATSVTTNGVVYGASSTAYASTAAGTTGTVLKGSTGGAPLFGTVSLTDDVSGTLPIANGGTGNGSSVTENYVFAGPATGPAGAPSYRALVAADIPSGIAASKISGIPYDIAGSAAGTPALTSTIFFFKAVRNATIATSGHQAGCRTNPSSTTTFTVKVNGGSIGTFDIDSSGVAAFSIAQTSLVAGDVVTVETGAAVNGIVDPYFTFFATLA